MGMVSFVRQPPKSRSGAGVLGLLCEVKVLPVPSPVLGAADRSEGLSQLQKDQELNRDLRQGMVQTSLNAEGTVQT